MSNNNPETKVPNPGTKDAMKAEIDELKAEKAELEAMKAQAEKDAADAKAELEALRNGVETNDTVPEEEHTAPDERVEIFIPRISGNTDPNFVIVINGKNYVMPRGQKSLVPKFVADEYERSKRAQYKVDNAIFEMVEQARQQAAAAGIK